MFEKTRIKSIILAAGMGTRLRPLTDVTPKPLLPILNQPILETILNKVSALGISETAVNTHYLSEQLKSFIDRSAFTDSVKLYFEPEILGTGGPFVNARDFLIDSDAILLHNGDILTDFDLGQLLACHLQQGNLVTMVLIDGPENKVRTVADGEGHGIIHDILDKLGDNPENSSMLTYSGIAAFSPEIFQFLPDKPEFCSIITAVIEGIKALPGRVGAYVPDRFYWNDIGTLRQYYLAHEDLLTKGNSFCFERSGIQRPSSGILVSDDSASLDSVDIRGFATIGPDCEIPAGTSISDCVILADTVLSRNETYQQSIIMGETVLHRDIRELESLSILAGHDLSDCRVKLLVEQGSSRRFYRLCRCDVPGDSQVLMISSGDDQDFERFIDYGRFFASLGLATPEIFSENHGEFTVLMEDLGDRRLYDDRDFLGDRALAERYSEVIETLCNFQVTATLACDQPNAPSFREFDYDYFRWETSYFREFFLEKVAGCDPSVMRRLDDEFHQLATNVKEMPHLVIHRDFQSQNIMLTGDGVRFVDFQGARYAPFAYDLMSLIQDPYVHLSGDIRATLQETYLLGLCDRVRSTALESVFTGISADKYSYYCTLCALQRNMQALGAYGFLSLVKGKMQYQAFIPQGWYYLRETVRRLNSGGSAFEMPRLANALEEYPVEGN